MCSRATEVATSWRCPTSDQSLTSVRAVTCCLGMTRKCSGACGSMSGKARARSVSASFFTGILPSTILQKMQSSMVAGISQLKNRLSAYLKKVRAGATGPHLDRDSRSRVSKTHRGLKARLAPRGAIERTAAGSDLVDHLVGALAVLRIQVLVEEM